MLRPKGYNQHSLGELAHPDGGWSLEKTTKQGSWAMESRRAENVRSAAAVSCTPRTLALVHAAHVHTAADSCAATPRRYQRLCSPLGPACIAPQTPPYTHGHTRSTPTKTHTRTHCTPTQTHTRTHCTRHPARTCH
mmetsp:Transcript_30841/g.61914  ORF Transcript_30841/g.61914 Transcript_30841/m.61914 type:complete len:136 (-) Transcript_30841:2092-2499(-)